MAFFRTDAGIRAGRIDQRNHRQIKFFGELHQAQRLAITFRMGAPEIPHHVFPGVAAFLIRDHNATLLAQHRDSARHGLVVAKQTVAVQLVPIRETTLDVIECERPLGVPRDLHSLPGTEISVNFPTRRFDLRFHCLDFGIEIERMFVGMIADFLQTALQFHNRFLELERLRLLHVTP